jgi:mannose-P-dolichol utilization defect 1
LCSDVVILYLFYIFGKEHFAGLLPNALVLSIALFNAFGMMGAIPLFVLKSLQPVAILIFVVCRIPQIWSNFKNKGTGQLAFLTVLAQFAGTLMRLITILIEVNDPMILGSSLTAFALNSTIFAQFLFYWWANSGSKPKETKKED